MRKGERIRHRKLSTRILAMQVAVLLIAVVVGFGLYLRLLRSDLNHQYEYQALVVARTAANDRSIQSAMAAGDPGGTVEATAERLRRVMGASYIVVLDRRGIRHSHPKPQLVGQRVSEPLVALDGKSYVDVDHGNLGLSANGKVPLYSPAGAIIGEVSAGIPERRVEAALSSSLPTLYFASGLALLAGTVASLVLARRLKQQTFGLELDEIATLLQEREAMLHGIREGVVTMDPDGRISLINEEARHLLGITGAAVGRRVEDLLDPGPVRDTLTGKRGQVVDQTVLTSGYALVFTRMPVLHGAVPIGAVATVRDRTETLGLLRELDSVRSLTDALRAQQHEHANRMHVLTGLLELGRYEHASSYLEEISDVAADHAETLRDTVGNPVVLALLLAKSSIASEQGVRLRIDVDTGPDSEEVGPGAPLLAGSADTRLLVTVIGNLVDNAIDAAAGTPGAEVELSLWRDTDATLHITVTDNGPGIADPEAVFRHGYTTKESGAPAGRGIGLALVHGLVNRAGGTIAASNDHGAVFDVVLPGVVSAAPVDARLP